MYAFVPVLALVTAAQAVEFEIVNNAGGPVWLGVQGNPGHEHLSNGGAILNQGQSITLQAAEDWAGRFWPRTWCDSNTQHCQTGDCGNKVECGGAGGAPPASLAEITLKGYGGIDYYDVSLVDGYNLQIAMEPIGGQGDGSQYSCTKCACGVNLLDICPQELKVINSEGATIACNSACGAFNTDEYCCRGEHSTPETCKSTDWPVDYPAFFKSNCPDAYSYAYDDHKSTFTCQAEKYRVTLG
ncbi:Pathogenesis-related protein 5-like Protein [Tribolium castaneum]|uniref:Pathogenesis-related protein 5-like Protein n=2 Tax=Tribolium castaneum TaxID=7070 RepID=D6W9V8_TRICA|nr:Pathogenesis-related protein 5-like Protein [Tribolium castaneum]